MSRPRRDASFVVRIWWERGETGHFHWRGQIVHAQTRHTACFENIAALVAFLEQWVGDLGVEANLSLDDGGQMSKDG